MILEENLEMMIEEVTKIQIEEEILTEVEEMTTAKIDHQTEEMVEIQAWQTGEMVAGREIQPKEKLLNGMIGQNNLNQSLEWWLLHRLMQVVVLGQLQEGVDLMMKENHQDFLNVNIFV